MEYSNDQENLLGLIARQESQIDMLEKELTFLNHLLVKVGFARGIETLKVAAEELLKENRQNFDSKEFYP